MASVIQTDIKIVGRFRNMSATFHNNRAGWHLELRHRVPVCSRCFSIRAPAVRILSLPSTAVARGARSVNPFLTPCAAASSVPRRHRLRPARESRAFHVGMFSPLACMCTLAAGVHCARETVHRDRRVSAVGKFPALCIVTPCRALFYTHC